MLELSLLETRETPWFSLGKVQIIIKGLNELSSLIQEIKGEDHEDTTHYMTIFFCIFL